MMPAGLSIRRALYSIGNLVGLGMLLTGCGYTLQGTRTNSLKEIGIEKIYVRPVKNLSYKPGVENVFYNELVQTLLAGRRVKLVDRPEMADAILDSTVEKAAYVPTAPTSAKSIFPTTVPVIEITIATEFQASVLCSFRLYRGKDGVIGDSIWDSQFTRSRRFAANNQKVQYGTTSGLINESEFERTLGEVAHGMMQDVHESMVARF